METVITITRRRDDRPDAQYPVLWIVETSGSDSIWACKTPEEVAECVRRIVVYG